MGLLTVMISCSSRVVRSTVLITIVMTPDNLLHGESAS